MFIQLFSYPTYIITQGGILYSSHQFIHVIVTTVINVINALQMNKLFDKRIGFVARFFALSTGLILKRLVRFFNHNPDAQETATSNKDDIEAKPSKGKKKKIRKTLSKSHSLNDLLDNSEKTTTEQINFTTINDIHAQIDELTTETTLQMDDT